MQPITIIGSNDENKNNRYTEHYEKMAPYAYTYDGRSAVGSQQYCPTGNAGYNIKKRKKQRFNPISYFFNTKHQDHNHKVNSKQNYKNKYRTLGIVTSIACIMTAFMSWAHFLFFAIIPIDVLFNSSPPESGKLWHPLVTTILGVISVIAYMKFDSVRLYKIVTGSGIVTICVLAFKKILDLEFASPGFGLIICLISGIILLMLPFVDCRTSIKNIHK